MHKWIEIIRVRSATDRSEDVLQNVTNLVDQVSTQSSGAETYFLEHALFHGDFSVVVVWKNDLRPEKSEEGKLLARKLSDLGTIDHSVWVPTQAKENKKGAMK